MKIKNFMKETGKELKKHSYNARSIMEELQGNAKLIDVIKNPKLNPDVIYNDDLGMTCYKKDKVSPEEDIAKLKKYDIIVNKKGSRPWVGYYEGRTPEAGGLKITILTADGDDYYMDQTAFGDSFFYYSWDDYDIYSPKRDAYKSPNTSGEEFDESLNESYNRDGDTVYDKETGFVYKEMEFTSDNEDDIYHELEKVQKGDLILMEINGVRKVRALATPIRKNSYVYIDTGHWANYQITSDFIVNGIMGGYISIFIRDEHYDMSKGEKIKDTGEDWDEQLNESPRIPTLRRHGVAYHQVDSANIFDAETLFDMLAPGKTIINVENDVQLMSRDYHQLTAGKYEVISKSDYLKRVDLKKTTLSRPHPHDVDKLFNAIERGDITLWYPTEKADQTNAASIINDTGDDWIEESVDPDYDDYEDIIDIKNKSYIRVPPEYIDDINDLMQYLKEKESYITNHNQDYYLYNNWTPNSSSGHNDIPYRLNLTYYSVVDGKLEHGYILADSLVGLLKNEQFALYLNSSIAKELGFLTKDDIPSGEEFNECLNERVQRGTYLRRHGVTYHKVDTNYIFDADTLFDMIKVNNTLLAGETCKYDVINKRVTSGGIKFLIISRTTSHSAEEWNIDDIFRRIENGYMTLWLPVGEAEAQNKPLEFDGSEFDESYKPLNEDWEEQDEPGVGIIEYKGHKYYKVDAERHIHKQSDLMKYLVKGMTIFKGNPNGKELIYQGWEPQKCCGYKLNDNPYELNFRMDGNSEGEYAPFRFSFDAMYGMIVNVEHLFDVYIPEALAERTGIKDEWELTSGDEFNECKNLKGKDLETLKEGTIISGKKEVKILNKKGNFYNVISEGKKYKYDIDDLKYDYTHKKIRIFEGKERLLKQASIAGFPKGYITSDDLYYRVSQPDDLFAIKDVGVPNYVQLHYVEAEDGYPDFELMSLSNLKRLYDMGKLKKIDTKKDGSEFKD